MTALWITRTEPGASALAALAAQAGIETIAAPLVGIKPSTHWREVDTGEPQAIIVTSRHAVSGYMTSPLFPAQKGTMHIALGEASAQDLRAAGLNVIVPSADDQAAVDADSPETSNNVGSEAVLNLREVERLVRSDEVWLVGGEGGRGTLEAEFKARGIRVAKLDFYQRFNLQPELDPAASIKWVEISSLAAMQGLEAYPQVAASKLVVPSARLKSLATERGFDAIMAASPTPAAVVDVVSKSDNSDTESGRPLKR